MWRYSRHRQVRQSCRINDLAGLIQFTFNRVFWSLLPCVWRSIGRSQSNELRDALVCLCLIEIGSEMSTVEGRVGFTFRASSYAMHDGSATATRRCLTISLFYHKKMKTLRLVGPLFCGPCSKKNVETFAKIRPWLKVIAPVHGRWHTLILF